MDIKKIEVTTGIYWIEVQKANLRILCGTPEDSVKHLMKKGLILSKEENGVVFETGPNAILLCDTPIQNGTISNLSEFPVLQMLYRQGMIIPNHPNNNGEKPMLIGSEHQVNSQLNYIYRGNYGLVSKEEIFEATKDKKFTDELMDIKLKFAFGKIKNSDELLDSCVVHGKQKIHIKNGLFVSSFSVNRHSLMSLFNIFIPHYFLGKQIFYP